MATRIKPHVQFGFERYLSVRTAALPSFSPDGRFIAFLADITGFPQVWRVPAEGGWPDQLSFAADRVMDAHYAHHSEEIVFSMDIGGSELAQLYLLPPGGEVEPLAVAEGVLHSFGAISPDDRELAFSSNRRHPAHFDVYVRPLHGGDARPVYQHDGSNMVDDWSPDGRFLLINRREGPLDSNLLLLDLSSGEATLLTPHAGLTQYASARFTPDGRGIYLITDRDSEFLRAARMDLETRELSFLTPDDADVSILDLSPDGASLAIVRNVEGKSRLIVRALTAGAQPEEREAPDLPPGIIGSTDWSHDGRLAFSFTGPRHNLNVWIWDIDSNECRQLTFASFGGLPQESLAAPEAVRFPSFDGLEIPGLLWMPDAPQPPIVVHVHGGPEGQARPQFNPVIQYLVSRGYAVLEPNVRGSTGYGRTYTHLDDVEKRMDSVADLEAAVSWLRSSGRMDADRIAVMGGSYGGFMVLAAVTTYPDLWAAAVDIVGIANLETFLRNTSAYRRHWRIPEYGDPDIHADFFRQISPIHHVDRIRAPMIVIHGVNDPRVPYSEAEQIVDALRARDVPVELLAYPDEGHGLVKLKNRLEAYPAIVEFLERHMRGTESHHG
jgi:dipeptidyl aminopeptidase/acylaminoacyl peptidase